MVIYAPITSTILISGFKIFFSEVIDLQINLSCVFLFRHKGSECNPTPIEGY